MKRMFFVLSLLASFATTSAFATEQIPASIELAFQRQFNGAHIDNSESVNGMIRISFTINNEQRNAYYNGDGELVILARQIDMNALPEALRSELQTRYAGYLVSGVYQFEEQGKVRYFSVLQKGGKSAIFSANGKKWIRA